MQQLILSAIFLTLPAIVSADEVWTTPSGTVVYKEDLNDVAIWETDNLDGTLRMYIPGLAGNIEDRSVHDGYWIQYAGQGCGSTLTGPDGHSGDNWGRLRIVFHSAGFPTNWTMLTGSCFAEPTKPLRGKSPLKP